MQVSRCAARWYDENSRAAANTWVALGRQWVDCRMSLRQAASNRQLVVVIAVVAAAIGLGTEGNFLVNCYDRDLAHVWSRRSPYAEIDGGNGSELSETRKER